MASTLRTNTFGLFLGTVLGATLAACTQNLEPETPTEEFRRREPAWISGQVMGVDQVPIDQYNDSTVHVIVTTEGEQKVRLALGPGWYMDENGLTFAPQQHIQFQGQPDPNGTYVARSVRSGDRTIELRNPDGSPRWPNKTAPGGSAPPAAPTPQPSEPVAPVAEPPPGPPVAPAPTAQ